MFSYVVIRSFKPRPEAPSDQAQADDQHSYPNARRSKDIEYPQVALRRCSERHEICCKRKEVTGEREAYQGTASHNATEVRATARRHVAIPMRYARLSVWSGNLLWDSWDSRTCRGIPAWTR